MEKDFDKLNEKILEKLETKIAIAEFEEKEEMKSQVKNVKKSKMKSYIGARVASIIAIIGLVSGNVYTFATYQKDLFTVILEKVGIFEAYEEEKTAVNLTKEGKNATLTLVDYAIDGDTVIVGYNLKLKEENEMLVKMVHDKAVLTSGGEKIELNSEEDESGRETYKDFGLFDEISKTEYSIYRFYKVDPKKLTNEMKLDVNIKIYDYDKEEYYNPTDGEPEMREFGNWDFSVNLNKAEMEDSFKEYYVEDKNAEFELVKKPNKNETISLAEVRLLKVKKSDFLTRFRFDLKGYSTNVVYFVEILDEAGNVILDRDVQYLYGGTDTEIITRKIDEEKIIINVYEMEPGDGLEIYNPSNTILSKATMKVDMVNELTEKKNTEEITRTWKGIEFKYNEYASNNEFSHDEVFGDFEKSTMYINFTEGKDTKDAYEWNYDNQINILRYTNSNNDTLEKVVEDIKLLETVGGYKYNPAKKHTIYLKDSTIMPDGLRAQEISFDQLIELAKGNKIVVQGVEVSNSDIDLNLTSFVENEETKIDGTKAITWIQEYSDYKLEYEWSGQYTESTGKKQRKYVFIANDYIYEITCPEGIENQEIVDNFINSIKIK